MRIMIVSFMMISLPALTAFSVAGPKPVATVLSEIRQDIGLKAGERIDVRKVTDSRLEELGDSVMEAMIGDPERHEQMDRIMGGEGSASLAEMHRRIGYSYLSGYPLGMMNMMAGGMAGLPVDGNFFRGGRHMMYGYYPGMMGSWGWGFGGIFMGLLFIIILLVAVFLIVRYARGGHLTSFGETPLDILKKRYAKGEISREVFDQMKKDIGG